jgi:DNA-binding MurR/RpiR family transcriptional regulator
VWWKSPEALAIAVLLLAVAMNIFFFGLGEEVER